MKLTSKKKILSIAAVCIVLAVLVVVFKNPLGLGPAIDSIVAIPGALIAGGGANQSNRPANSRGGPGGGGGFPGGGTQTAFPVKVEAVAIKSISQYLTTNTTLEARRLIDVLAKASGRVIALVAEEGDRVAIGDILASLDRVEIELELQEAVLDLVNATKNFERTQTLRAQNIVSEEELETQQHALEVSKIKLHKAQIKLDNTHIKSPIGGVVTSRLIDLGDTINQNQHVFSVGDFNPLLAKIHIPEREMGRVKVGQSVKITSESFGEEVFGGVVKRISPVVDAASGTIKITIEVTSAKNKLKPGMFITVYLAVATHKDALVVPKKAIVLERESEVVFVMTESNAVRVPVGLGFSEKDFVEITSGLKQGDNVITVGQETLQDGTPVRLVGDQLAAAPEAGSQDGRRQDGRTPAGDSGQGARSQGGGRPQGGARPQGGDASPGGFDLSSLPPDRRKSIEKRLLGNPEIKSEYEKRLKADPALAKDQDKRAAFFQEMMQKFGRNR